MSKIRILIPLCALMLLGAAPDPQDAGARYKMMPGDGGAFLRLDTLTGAMSVCQRRDGRWSCEAMADDRRALDAEIARLQGEVKRLEELLALPDPEGGGRRADSGRPKFQIPSEEEIDRAMDTVQRMVRKFRDRWRDMKEDFKTDRRSL
jgi:hypothetical protein